jgi:hypothetical protein
MNIIKNIIGAFILMFTFILMYIFSQDKNPENHT